MTQPPSILLQYRRGGHAPEVILRYTIIIITGGGKLDLAGRARIYAASPPPCNALSTSSLGVIWNCALHASLSYIDPSVFLPLSLEALVPDMPHAYWIGIPPLPAQTVRDSTEKLHIDQFKGINEVPNHWQSLVACMEKCICSNHDSIRRGRLGYIRIANGPSSKTNPTELPITGLKQNQSICCRRRLLRPSFLRLLEVSLCLILSGTQRRFTSFLFGKHDGRHLLLFPLILNQVRMSLTTEAAAFWFFSRALSLWLPRAMLLLRLPLCDIECRTYEHRGRCVKSSPLADTFQWIGLTRNSAYRRWLQHGVKRSTAIQWQDMFLIGCMLRDETDQSMCTLCTLQQIMRTSTCLFMAKWDNCTPLSMRFQLVFLSWSLRTALSYKLAFTYLSHLLDCWTVLVRNISRLATRSR
ncbi:hypothetical protein KC359_g103 [Hortaea werneckii]|nr:hypothetical protein KC359_g103 [Hortaea werneckii]